MNGSFRSRVHLWLPNSRVLRAVFWTLSTLQWITMGAVCEIFLLCFCLIWLIALLCFSRASQHCICVIWFLYCNFIAWQTTYQENYTLLFLSKINVHIHLSFIIHMHCICSDTSPDMLQFAPWSRFSFSAGLKWLCVVMYKTLKPIRLYGPGRSQMQKCTNKFHSAARP